MVSMRIRIEQSLKCREVGFEMKWLYIGIEWPRDINSDACARRTVTTSDSTCPADGVSLAISTLLLIPEGFCAGTKTILDRAYVQ